MQEDSFKLPLSEVQSSEHHLPSFPVIGQINLKPVAAEPGREAASLSPAVTRLVSLVGLSAVLLGPLNACSSTTSDSSVPCPVPTSSATGKPVTTSATTIKCTTSSGQYYLWTPSHGGWVPSDDGVHPNPNAKGVGEEAGHSSGTSDGHSGVGDGSSGAGHGGGDGG